MVIDWNDHETLLYMHIKTYEAYLVIVSSRCTPFLISSAVLTTNSSSNTIKRRPRCRQFTSRCTYLNHSKVSLLQDYCVFL